MNLSDLFREFHQVPILYYPIHRKLLPDATTTLLFAYVVRETQYRRSEEIYSTDQEVLAVTGLTAYELSNAKKSLRNLPFMAVERRGEKGKTHYRIDLDRLEEALRKLGGSDLRGSKIRSGSDLRGSKIRTTGHYMYEPINTMSAPAEAGRPTAREKERQMKKWKRLADQLATAIQKVQKLTYTGQRSSWAKSFKALHDRDGVEFPRIKKALTWYCDNLPKRHGEAYFLVILSGDAFRRKFGQLEAAVARERKDREIQNGPEEEDVRVHVEIID